MGDIDFVFNFNFSFYFVLSLRLTVELIFEVLQTTMKPRKREDTKDVRPK